MESIRNALKWLQKFVDRAWYFPVVGFLAGLDLFVFVVPTDALLISSVMLRPRKWLTGAFWVGFGSALGALALAAFIQWDAQLVMEQWFPSMFDNALWRSMDSFFDRYGQFALILIALSPLLQFPAIAIAALAGMSLAEIFLVSLVGRTIKSGVVSWLASHAPKLLTKVPLSRQDLAALETPPHE